MRCPHCDQFDQVFVIESRHIRRHRAKRRRLECRRCRLRWTTEETIVSEPVPVSQLARIKPVPPPPLPPAGVPHCHRCHRWVSASQRCDLDFPEALVEPDFAKLCLHYHSAETADDALLALTA